MRMTPWLVTPRTTREILRRGVGGWQNAGRVRTYHLPKPTFHGSICKISWKSCQKTSSRMPRNDISLRRRRERARFSSESKFLGVRWPLEDFQVNHSPHELSARKIGSAARLDEVATEILWCPVAVLVSRIVKWKTLIEQRSCLNRVW